MDPVSGRSQHARTAKNERVYRSLLSGELPEVGEHGELPQVHLEAVEAWDLGYRCSF